MLRIESFEPTEGPIGTSVTMTVSGLASTAGVVVRLGDTPAQGLTVTLDGQSATVEFSVPEVNAARWPVSIYAEGSSALADEAFTVTEAHPIPHVTNVYPARVKAYQMVTIRGGNLSQVTAIRLATVQVGSFQKSDTLISFLISPNILQRFQPPVSVQIFLSFAGGTVNTGKYVSIVADETPRASVPSAQAIPPSIQSAITDVWKGLKPWVEGKLAASARNLSIDDTAFSTSLGVCAALNVGGTGDVLWGDDGDGSMTVSSASITAFDSAEWQPATFTDDGRAQLRAKVTNLGISGRYDYAQPCGAYFDGKVIETSSTSGGGSVTQTVSSGELLWEVDVTSSPSIQVTLERAYLDTEPSISVSPDSSGNAALDALTNFFGGNQTRQALQAATWSALASASFSQVLIGLLNSALAKQSRAGLGELETAPSSSPPSAAL